MARKEGSFMTNSCCLGRMSAGDSAQVTALRCPPALQHRLSDMGVFPGTEIRCLAQCHGRGLGVYLIRGAAVALRQRDCGGILMGGMANEI